MREIMTQWLVDQFPGAEREEQGGVINQPNGRTVLTFHINSYTYVTFIVEDPGFRMYCNFTKSLEEYFSFEGQDIVGGHWNSGERISIADPDFNIKLCRMLCTAVTIISMGAINPFMAMEQERHEHRHDRATS